MTCFTAFAAMYRTWYDEMAGGGIPWPSGTSAELGPVLPREVVMDRYSQHVEGCRSCRKALQWIGRLQVSGRGGGSGNGVWG